MASVPITLAKAHMNIVGTDDDELISHYIEAAESWIADYIGTAMPDPIPASLKQAILMLASHWYENREASVVGISAGELPFGVVNLIRPYREWSFSDDR